MAASLFERILLATDLGSIVDRFTWCFPDLSALGTKEVILVHALPHCNGQVPGQCLDEKEYKDKLNEQAKVLESSGVSVRPSVVSGPAGTAILELADKESISLVVVGTRQEVSKGRSMLGCTSYSVLHETTKPTLIIPTEKKKDTDSCLTHILYPTDFSETAEHAFLYVEALAAVSKCNITLYHVHDKTRIDPYLRDRLPEFDKIDRERMERLKAHLEFNQAGNCKVELAYGVPAQKILNMAKKGDYSLIVMGTQGRGFIPEIHLGSIANAIARHAPISVLFVPLPR